jgi:putative flippase GtrA
MSARIDASDGGRFAVFALGGGLIAACGVVVLAGLVAIGIEPGVAYGVQLLLTLVANYAFTRHVTFRDRLAPFSRTQVWRFACTRGATLLGGWLLFLVQVDGVGLPYLLAYVTCLAVTSAVNYLTSEAYVFVEVPTR